MSSSSQKILSRIMLEPGDFQSNTELKPIFRGTGMPVSLWKSRNNNASQTLLYSIIIF